MTKRSSLIKVFVIVIFLFTCFMGLISVTMAETYYVSIDGNSSNPGTLSKPWKTVRHAAQTLVAGDTVLIREGTYNEMIVPQNSGTSDKPITYKAYPGENVIITYGATTSPLWYQNGVRYIVIEGITFEGQFHIQTAMYFQNAEHVTVTNCIIQNFENPYHDGGHGIWVNGNCDYLLVEDTNIYRCGSKSNPSSQSGGNVNIRNGGVSPGNNNHITFRNCDIYEAYTEDGIQIGDNVECKDFLVENCRFWSNKEDGVDVKRVTGALIKDSVFYDHHESPTGGGAGVVIHMGARDVVVANCISYGNDDGFAVGNWFGQRTVENITIRRSVMRNNKRGIIGGDENKNQVNGIHIYNNVFYDNSEDGIHWWYFDPPTDIRNNIFYKNSNVDIHIPERNPSGLTLDHNDYPGGGRIEFSGRIYDRASLETALGYESHGLSVDPLFVDESSYDFNLKSTSPLIDQGVDVGLSYQGSAPDMGAYEHPAGNPPDTTPPDPPTGLKVTGD